MTALNSWQFNTIPVNGPEKAQNITFAGEIISIEQIVGHSFVGNIISIEQTIKLRETFVGNIISIEQTIGASFSGNIISIEQNILQTIIPDAPATHVARFGWDTVLTVGGYIIPKNQITGTHDVTKTSNNSSLMNIRIRPPIGVQDITFYQGKTVTLDYETPTGTKRVFTGVVDIPDIDALGETINLKCTNRRQELINSTLSAFVPTFGYYSEDVFGEPVDLAQEAAQRLETIPFSLELDSFNNFHLIAWEPKAVPEFTLDDIQVYNRDTEIKVASRGRIINKVNIELEYRYERSYHVQRSYEWTSPIDNNPCLMLVQGYDMARRDIIQAAVDSTGWPVNGAITFGGVTPDGIYRCGASITPIVWHNITTSTFEANRTDSDGVEITDPNGNPIVDTITSSVTDMSDVFADSASFKLTKRWAQTVSEKFTLTVQSPQSIAQYGEISRDESHGVLDDFDSSEWENYTAYTNLGLGTSYFIDRNENIGNFNTASDVILNRAKTTILGSHRDNTVTITRSLWPEVELHHTVQLTLDAVATKGRVTNINHMATTSTGEAVTMVEITLSRATGSGTDSVLSTPVRPSDSPTLPTQKVFLGNHFGEDPTTEAAKSWNGFIGNKFLGVFGQGTFKTQYQISFTVDTPAIDVGLRNERILTASQSYNVAIRNDSLVWTTDGKL